MKARYRIRQKPGLFTDKDGYDTTDSTETPAYGLWDSTLHCWVNKYGEPDEEYAAVNRAVAEMRRRDLNIYESERLARIQ
jgi:hypothetical protein